MTTVTETNEPSDDAKYLIFQALSHPLRVKILMLIQGNGLTFSSLKHEVGMESSGQLQHHLQKLSGLFSTNNDGSYGLTDVGRRALAIFNESERSGRSLEDLCCLPTPREMALENHVGKTGSILRLSIGSVLLALTIAILAEYFLTGQPPLTLYLSRSSFVSFGFTGAAILGFFGISFLLSALSGYPGCEITAIPNLFSSKKRYCACIMAPFNLPDGRLLVRNKINR